MRMFPQDHIPELESWSHLKELIPVACDRVRRENPQYGDPRQFIVYGRTFMPKRRGEYGPRKVRNLLEMAVTYNPRTNDITVDAASFDRSLEDIEEDMRFDLGDPLLKPFHEESLRESASLANIDVLRLPPEAEPIYPSQPLGSNNEWHPRLVNEWIPRRADEEQRR